MKLKSCKTGLTNYYKCISHELLSMLFSGGDRQTDRQTDRQIHMPVCMHTHTVGEIFANNNILWVLDTHKISYMRLYYCGKLILTYCGTIILASMIVHLMIMYN